MIARVARSLVLVLVPCLWLGAHVSAETIVPAKGQSPELVQRDLADCAAAAKQSSGYDPAQASATSAPAQTQTKKGGRVRGAAVGAAAAAAGAQVRGNQHEGYDQLSDEAQQQYRQNQAKEGAAAGAVVGASRQRRERRDTQQQAAQQSAQTDAKASAYQQAYHGCLLGRGYTITP